MGRLKKKEIRRRRKRKKESLRKRGLWKRFKKTGSTRGPAKKSR